MLGIDDINAETEIEYVVDNPKTPSSVGYNIEEQDSHGSSNGCSALGSDLFLGQCCHCSDSLVLLARDGYKMNVDDC